MAETKRHNNQPSDDWLKTPISRRRFLTKAGAVVGMAISPALILEATTDSNAPHHTPKKPVFESDLIPAPVTPVRPKDTLEQGLKFSAEFQQGILGNWRKVSVWPGIALLPSDMPLFASADLNPDTVIEWPTEELNRHLLVQRPFMVRSSAERNMHPVDPAIDDQVMAFCLPRSKELLYCARESAYASVVLASNYTDGQYTKRGSMVGEPITLEPTAEADGLVWRYLEAPRNEGYIPQDIVTEIKVCGRSAWATPAEAAEAYFDFSEMQGNDIIQLPRGIAQ